ncbi:MAG: hypothetical protein WCJ64_05930 [Rhodospirillaceae bacterium]
MQQFEGIMEKFWQLPMAARLAVIVGGFFLLATFWYVPLAIGAFWLLTKSDMFNKPAAAPPPQPAPVQQQHYSQPEARPRRDEIFFSRKISFEYSKDDETWTNYHVIASHVYEIDDGRIIIEGHCIHRRLNMTFRGDRMSDVRDYEMQREYADGDDWAYDVLAV